MTAIIDYGVGNLFSLSSSLRHIGAESKITCDPEEILTADRVILPGVGAFGDAMSKLRETGLVPAVLKAAGMGTPLLGICVGMQMLFKESFEYGRHEGIGLLPGSVYPIEDEFRAKGLDLKVPQIGWNSVTVLRPDSPIMKNTGDGDFYYYVHSYCARGCGAAVIARSEYGVDITGVAGINNVYGSQFHPEKSGEAGLSFLRAFCEI